MPAPSSSERGLSAVLAALAGGLVVSCQAPAGSPMRDTGTIVRLARSALLGGASGLRVNSPDDVAAVRALGDRPIIALHKTGGERRDVITVRDEEVVALVAAGADIVAVDATTEVFADVEERLLRAIAASSAPVMADVSTLEEGLRAWDAGAPFVGTTLSGYTPYSRDARADGAPDVELVELLAARGVRVLAEGRYATPEQVESAFAAGAFAVVVGGAITDPVAITRRFVAARPAADR